MRPPQNSRQIYAYGCASHLAEWNMSLGCRFVEPPEAVGTLDVVWIS